MKLLLSSIVLLLSVNCSIAQSLILNPKISGVDGQIKEISYSTASNKYAIIGNFQSTTSDIGQNIFSDSSNSTINFNKGKIDGIITSVIEDGLGGYFIAGNFSSFWGLARKGIVHIDNTGEVSSKIINISSNYYIEFVINELVLYNGKLLIVGAFDKVNGVSRGNFAEVDISTCTVTNKIFNVNGEIKDISNDGDNFYCIGQFTQVNGVNRNNVFSFSHSTNSFRNWYPQVNGTIRCVESKQNKVYLGGDFSQVNGVSRAYFASIDGISGNLLTFNPTINGSIVSFALNNNDIYLNGMFSSINSISINSLAKINTVTNTINSVIDYSPSFSFSMKCLNSTLYLSGSEYTINGITKYGACAINLNTNQFKSWYSNPSYGISFISPIFDEVLITSMNEDPKRIGNLQGLCVFDDNSFDVSNWCSSFNVNGSFTNCSVLNDKLFLGGNFNQIQGQNLEGLASIDLNTGQLNPWTNYPETYIELVASNNDAVVTYGSTLFNGNYVTELAFFNPTTGVKEYAINLDNFVGYIKEIQCTNNQVFIIGDFTEFLNQPRNNFAAVNTSNHQLDPFVLNTDYPINSMDLDDSTLLISGYFSNVNGQNRNGVAIVNINNHQLYSYDHNLLQDSYTLDFPNVFSVNNNNLLTTLESVTTSLLHEYSFSNERITFDGSHLLSYSNTGILNFRKVTCADTVIQDVTTTCDYFFNNQLLTKNGTYFKTISNSTGCDSVYQLNLVLQNSYDSIVVNGVYFVTVNNQNLTNPNTTYEQHFTNIYGCDSTLYINAIFSQQCDVFDTVYAENFYEWNPTYFIGGQVNTYLLYQSGDYIDSNLYTTDGVNWHWSHQLLHLTISNDYQNQINQNLWGPNGSVKKIFHDSISNSVFLSGTFDYVGPKNQFAAFFPAGSPETIENSPVFNNTVNSIIGDGNNGFFAGGDFTNVNNLPHNRIVHLASDLSILPFNSNFNGSVLKIIKVGNELLVSGEFTNYNGSAVTHLISISAINGDLLKVFNLTNTPDDFSFFNDTVVSISYQAIKYFNFNTSLGILSQTLPGDPLEMAVTPSYIHVTGFFANGAGLTNNTKIRTYNRTNLQEVNFNPQFNNIPYSSTYQLGNIGDTLFISGPFTTAESQPRNRIAAYFNGTLLNYNLNLDNSVVKILSYNNSVYLQGLFTTVLGQNRNGFAKIDANGTLNNFTLNHDGGGILSIYENTNYTIFAGSFSSCGGYDRKNLVQIDLTTKKPTNLILDVTSPNLSWATWVNDFERVGNRLFFGGGFTYINGISRNRLFEYDVITNSITSFNPNFNGDVLALESIGDTLIAAGYFTNSNSTIRNRLCSFDLSNNSLSTWNPNLNAYVNDIEIVNNVLLVGGNFSTISGQSKQRLAAFNLPNLTLNPINLDANDVINDIQLQDSFVYIGGEHTSLSGIASSYLTKLNALNLSFEPLNCIIDNSILKIASSEDHLFLLGTFSQINSSNRTSFGSIIIPLNGVTSNFYPNCSVLYDIQTINDSIYFAGDFDLLSNLTQKNFVEMKIPSYVQSIDSITSCDPINWVDGFMYNQDIDSVYFIPFSYYNDSVIELVYNNTGALQNNTTISAINSYFWPVNGQTYSNSGTFIETFNNQLGCDSVVTLELTIQNAYYSNLSQISCENYFWSVNNQNYTQSGQYIDTLQSISGIDSIITLNLTILQSTNSIDSYTVCDSLTWIDGITYYSNNTTATHIIPNAAGCDSIITLNLTILQTTNSIDSYTVCDSLMWIDGITYYSNNTTATYIITNAAGCDSIITLNLTLLQPTYGIDVQNDCDSLIWIDGITYYSNNSTATHIIPNSAGCDSIITLNFTIVPAQPLILANSFSLPSDANNCIGQAAITVSGNADFELTIDNGLQIVTTSGYSVLDNLCPGVHDLKITDNCGDTLHTALLIPVDSNYVYNNPYLDSMAVDSLGATLTNCTIYYNSIDTAYIDSIWSVGNVVNVVWNIVDASGSNYDTSSYVLNNGNGVYLLQLSVFCPTKALGDYFTVTEAIYFENGNVYVTGIDEKEINHIAIHPNPTNDYVSITSANDEIKRIVIYDLYGKELQNEVQNGSTYLISLNTKPTGIYLFKITTTKGQVTKRVVKQ